MTSLGTYWRTLRHLRAGQVVGRVRHRLHRPRVRAAAAPPRRGPAGTWVEAARRLASLVGPHEFSFLNERHVLRAGAWDDASIARLWRYNLHYFDDLNASGAAQRRGQHRALIEQWIAENPPARGTGWEPYPASLRIVNWIKWSMAGNAFEPHWLHSLAIQVRWLSERLETHLLGNHLFANAKALVFAGLYFDGGEAARWFETGCAILARELDEQILADGGHFERSPMYHALALEDVLDLVDVIAALGPQLPRAAALATTLRAKVGPMQRWLRTLTHPDGTLAMFNDCAMEIAPSATELTRLAAALGLPPVPAPTAGVTRLDPSGYLRLELGAAVALVDVAPIGPDYLPGHAHADTLSFELSLHGRRVVVNAGTSCYGDDARRRYERSTAAHSTVQVDGVDSSEVWSGFRVGRRARPVGTRLEADALPWRLCAAHDGYRHLPGRPQHERSWQLDHGELVVRDRVAGGSPAAVARYLLAPGVRARAHGDGWQLDDGAGAPLASVEVLEGGAALREARVTTRFGCLDEATCLELTLEGGRAATRWRWRDDAHPVSHR